MPCEDTGVRGVNWRESRRVQLGGVALRVAALEGLGRGLAAAANTADPPVMDDMAHDLSSAEAMVLGVDHRAGRRHTRTCAQWA